MTDDQAQQAVVISSLVVSGIYFYRKLSDQSGAIPAKAGHQTGSLGRLVGAGPPPPLGRWIVGFGVSFFVLSVMTAVSPPLGAWTAILLAVGTILTNGMALSTDIQRRTA